MSSQPDLAVAPKGIAAQPAKAGGKSNGIQSHMREQHPRKNDPDADMSQRTDERQHDPACAAVITGEGVAGKAEGVKQCHESQIRNSGGKSNAFARAKQQSDGIRSKQEHSDARKCSQHDHPAQAAPRWLPLCQDPLLAVVPEKHPLANRKSVPLETLLPEPYIRTCPGMDIDGIRFFEHRGVKPNMQFSTMDIQATYAMVGAGLGYAVSNRINSNFSDPAVRHLPIAPPEIIEIGLAYRKEPAPAAEAFLKFIKVQLPCEKS